MGARKTTFLEIQTRLLDKVPNIQAIALYNGQPEAMKLGTYEDIPYPLPAIFIQLVGGAATTNGALIREIDNYTIRLHYCFEIYQDDFHTSPHQEAALSHLDRLEEVMNALDHWGGATLFETPLQLALEFQDETRTHIGVHVIDFTGRFVDCTLADAEALPKQQASELEIIRLGESEHPNVEPNKPQLTTNYTVKR